MNNVFFGFTDDGVLIQGNTTALHKMPDKVRSSSPVDNSKEEVEDDVEDDEDEEMQTCQWENCIEEFITIEELINHVKDDHIGSGKVKIHSHNTGKKRANFYIRLNITVAGKIVLVNKSLLLKDIKCIIIYVHILAKDHLFVQNQVKKKKKKSGLFFFLHSLNRLWEKVF